MDDAPRGVLKPAWLVWLCLSLILAGYVASIVRLRPTNFFGATEDDSIYFSSAKALAEGRGYILPSVPGTPPATKYPILYPLILSAVWKLNPSFPANLPWAIAVTVVFGFVYIVAGFVFLRRLQVLHDAEVLLLTAFCAFHPVVLFYSASVLSDIPFAALALVAMLLADSMLKPAARPQIAVLCGVMAGLSMMMRMFGLAVVAGILLAILMRRAWKQLVAFVAGVAPFFLFTAWRAALATKIVSPVSDVDAGNLGWVRAWAYYTNYFAIWKVSVPDAHVFWAMLRNNAFTLATGPAHMLQILQLPGDSLFGTMFVIVLCILVAAGGMLRHASAHGWKPFHYIMPLYLFAVIFWNYPDFGHRFLFLFWFLCVGVVWIESRRFLKLLIKKVADRQERTAERFASAMTMALLLVMGGYAIWQRVRASKARDLVVLSNERGIILNSKREAYRWLAQQPCCEPVLAYEDADVYLYSGRTAIRPEITVTGILYDPRELSVTVNHIMDIGQHVGAQYWFFSDDESTFESQNANDATAHCLGKLGPSIWPAVFQSRDKRVIIRSLQHSNYSNPCKTTE
jgi:hypothetical protein